MIENWIRHTKPKVQEIYHPRSYSQAWMLSTRWAAGAFVLGLSERSSSTLAVLVNSSLLCGPNLFDTVTGTTRMVHNGLVPLLLLFSPVTMTHFDNAQ